MIDLTNRNSNEINALVNKYASLLEFVKPDEQANHAYIFDYAIKYLNTNFGIINKIWKSWIIVVVKKSISNINSEPDIETLIKDFIVYHNNNYEAYREDIVGVDEIDRDCGFIHMFINEKNR